MSKTKIKTNCSYCGADDFYIYHRKKYSNEELESMPQNELMKMAKTLGIQTSDKKQMVDDVFRMQKIEIDWAICFKCTKNAMDKALGEGKDGGRIEHKED